MPAAIGLCFADATVKYTASIRKKKDVIWARYHTDPTEAVYQWMVPKPKSMAIHTGISLSSVSLLNVR